MDIAADEGATAAGHLEASRVTVAPHQLQWAAQAGCAPAARFGFIHAAVTFIFHPRRPRAEAALAVQFSPAPKKPVPPNVS